MAFEGTVLNVLSRDEHRPMYSGDGDGVTDMVPVGVPDAVRVRDGDDVGRVEPDGCEDGETDPARVKVTVDD
jgi:hypothetical protein